MVHKIGFLVGLLMLAGIMASSTTQAAPQESPVQAAPARKALINNATGVVSNVILLEPGANWTAPAGFSVQDAGIAGPGDTWDGSKFNKAPDPTPIPESFDLQAAKFKLKLLGLSDNEIAALIGAQ